MSTTAQTRLQEGRYQAVSIPAVVSVVCGAFSVLTALSWYLAVVPVTGIVVGRVALLQIREKPHELTGRTVAWVGVSLSVAFWIFGYARLTFSTVSEAPWGYTRLHYDDLQPDPDRASELIPPSIYEYQDKKVYLKGYMEAGRQQRRLKMFRLCPEIADCPFCTVDPSPTEVVVVVLEGDLTTDYTTHAIGVGGVLKIDLKSPTGLPYLLKADVLR